MAPPLPRSVPSPPLLPPVPTPARLLPGPPASLQHPAGPPDLPAPAPRAADLQPAHHARQLARRPSALPGRACGQVQVALPGGAQGFGGEKGRAAGHSGNGGAGSEY